MPVPTYTQVQTSHDIAATWTVGVGTPVEGEFLVWGVVYRSDSQVTTPSGWTVAVNAAAPQSPDYRSAIYYKTAGASETDFSVTTANDGRGYSFVMRCPEGCALNGTPVAGNGSGNPLTFSGPTTTAEDCLLVFAVSSRGTTNHTYTDSAAPDQTTGLTTLFTGANLTTSAGGRGSAATAGGPTIRTYNSIQVANTHATDLSYVAVAIAPPPSGGTDRIMDISLITLGDNLGASAILRNAALSSVSLGIDTGTAAIPRSASISAISLGDNLGAAAILRGAQYSLTTLGDSLGAASIDRAMSATIATVGDSLGASTISRSMSLSALALGESVGAAIIPRSVSVALASLGESIGAAAISRGMALTLVTLADALGALAQEGGFEILGINSVGSSVGAVEIPRSMGLSAVSLGESAGAATVDRGMVPSLISVGDSVGAAAILRGLGFNAVSLGNNLGAATIDRAMRFGLITLGDALGSTDGEVPVGAIETSPGIVVAIRGEYVWVQLVPEYVSLG